MNSARLINSLLHIMTEAAKQGGEKAARQAATATGMRRAVWGTLDETKREGMVRIAVLRGEQMQIVTHTCGQHIYRRGEGEYTATAEDEQRITSCPFCAGPLADDYLSARGRRVRGDSDDDKR